jgi:hypothetical protein
MNRIPPTLDMHPDGSFRTPAQPRGVPLSFKVMAIGVVVAFIAASLALAALAAWILSMVLPVLIIAGGVVWATAKFRRWQLRGGRDLRQL